VLRALINADRPSISWIGIGLSISSMLVMPLLGRAKHRIGSQLGSGATAGEGTQNMLCAYLAASVLVGLALNVALGLWWADPVVALGIAAVAIKEGRETWRGEGRCATTPIAADADQRLPGRLLHLIPADRSPTQLRAPFETRWHIRK
jgi:hypothetical protein